VYFSSLVLADLSKTLDIARTDLTRFDRDMLEPQPGSLGVLAQRGGIGLTRFLAIGAIADDKAVSGLGQCRQVVQVDLGRR
jgi:hypothetical protein